MTSINEALKKTREILSPSSSTPQADAEILLGFVLKKARAYLYTYPEQILKATDHQTYQELIEKRIAGVPIAYLTGRREFWSLPLQVSEDTLIPRSETELLVELTLRLLKDISTAFVLDLGTGSGAIALALGFERPEWHLLACDVNPNAVAIAQQNADQLNLTNVDFYCSDWFSSIPEQRFHAIVSNPPYIAEEDPHLTSGDLRFEPQEALSSGEDGLLSLRYIIKQSPRRLLPGGLLLLEHGFDQKQAVRTMLEEAGYEGIDSWRDANGQDRVSGGWRRS